MNTKLRPRFRTGTQAESLRFASELAACNYANAKADAADISLPDGNPSAVRIQFNRDTGEPGRWKDNSLRICAPWLLQQFFR